MHKSGGTETALGSTLDALGVRVARKRARAIANVFCEAPMPSSTVQQVQLPCASSDSLLHHNSSRGSSSSPTTWRRGKSISRSLLLRVCVHPQFDFTHRQLLQYVALLPRVHGIETEAALREHGNCKLLLLFLSLC
jgi:hypothetical protein